MLFGLPSRHTRKQISNKYGIPRSTIYFWLKKYKDMPTHHPDNYLNIAHNRPVEKRQEQKLKNICEILQKVDCTVSPPLRIKLYELEKLYGQYNVHHLSKALQVDCGGLYTTRPVTGRKYHYTFCLSSPTLQVLP